MLAQRYIIDVYPASIPMSGQRWANVILSIGPTLAKNYIGPKYNALSV